MQRLTAYLFAILMLMGTALNASAQQKPTVIKWGYVTTAAFYWDVFAAIDHGFMANENVVIEPVRVDAASQSIQLLLTGAVDILSTIPDLTLNAIDKGAQLSIIGSEVVKVPWEMMVRPEIRNYSDLKGKILGVSQIKDASTGMMRLLLQKKGLKPTDYETIQLGGTPNRFAALHKGAVQGAILAQPADFKAEAAGMKRLGSVSEAFEGPAIVFVARKDWLKANGDSATRFLRGATNGGKWLYDPKNKEDAIKVLIKNINAQDVEARQTYDMYITRDKIISTDGQLPLQHIQNYLDVREEKTKATPASYTDFSHLKKAAAK